MRARRASHGSVRPQNCGVMRQTMPEWFRNATWNAAVAQVFEEKLRRARRKEQYLRIQACTLATSHPQVALDLLERYFALPDQFDQAQAYVDRAQALLALSRADDAIESYEAALAREVAFPKLQTQAYLDLPFLIATRGIKSRYEQAVNLLELHENRLMFPVDHFRWHTARCLIAADVGAIGVAKPHAAQALNAAGAEHSGFRYHREVGLVTERYEQVVQRLRACLAA
jgi:tetratricopeptide (TPR) repeat protein